METVINHERSLGRQAFDVSEKNLGYDVTSLDLESGELRLIEVKGLGTETGIIRLTPTEKRVAEDRRDCYWLYVVTNCKRLAEVDFPISAVSKHALPEKNLRHGHPSTFHLWWDIFEPRVDTEAPRGTVARARATCVCCGTTLPADRVRAQLAAQRSGADVIFDKVAQRIAGARMLAVVTLPKDVRGRKYRLPTAPDYAAVYGASAELKRIAATGNNSPLSTIPDGSRRGRPRHCCRSSQKSPRRRMRVSAKPWGSF
jgi:hypothetical protein